MRINFKIKFMLCLEFPEISSDSINNFYVFSKYLGAGGFGSGSLSYSIAIKSPNG